MLADRETVLRLAVRGGELVGFANLGSITITHPVDGPAAELRQLYLPAEAKGTGVADALMDWAIASARARGAEALYLTVYVDNHRARAFYARYGFADVGRHDFPVGEHIDEDRILRLAL
jgi:ribosomal protein S18 acetylase RimI-like enzyme